MAFCTSFSDLIRNDNDNNERWKVCGVFNTSHAAEPESGKLLQSCLQ